MKIFTAAIAASTLVLAQTPAYAGNGCYGCNVRDEGVLNSSLVNTTIYYQGVRGVANAIDTYNGKVFVSLSDGRSGWAYATETYTAASQRERGDAGVVVAAGVVALIACAFFCSSGSSSSASSSSYSGGSSGRSSADDNYARRNRTASPPAAPSTPAASTSGLYGNCHGGSFYGCPN